MKSKRITSTLITFGLGLTLIGGCQLKQQAIKKPSSIEREEISRLQMRINKLEALSKISASHKANKKMPSNPIKSITFRIGTTDDRLRIYWADGSKTDLPCTKEQAIWACG